jgi:hypothetical protein
VEAAGNYCWFVLKFFLEGGAARATANKNEFFKELELFIYMFVENSYMAIQIEDMQIDACKEDTEPSSRTNKKSASKDTRSRKCSRKDSSCLCHIVVL